MTKLMTLKYNDKEFDIDILEITNAIDSVFHEKLTKQTGITVEHQVIELFVGYIFNEHNKLETSKNLEFKKLMDKSFEKNSKLMHRLSKM